MSSSTASNSGAFINSVRGSSYIYGCFTDIKVNINNADIGYIAGLIGEVNALKTVVDNCGSNSYVSSTNNNSAIASFIGGIKNNSGTVSNSYVGGLVQRGGYIAIGTKGTAHKVENRIGASTTSTPQPGDDSHLQLHHRQRFVLSMGVQRGHGLYPTMSVTSTSFCLWEFRPSPIPPRQISA